MAIFCASSSHAVNSTSVKKRKAIIVVVLAMFINGYEIITYRSANNQIRTKPNNKTRIKFRFLRNSISSSPATY